MYRRAQNGEVGSVASANVPESIAMGSPGRRVAQAEPDAGASSCVFAAMTTTPFLSLAGGLTTQGITLLWRLVVDSHQQGLTWGVLTPRPPGKSPSEGRGCLPCQRRFKPLAALGAGRRPAWRGS
jgi:hypothetical protein